MPIGRFLKKLGRGAGRAIKTVGRGAGVIGAIIPGTDPFDIVAAGSKTVGGILDRPSPARPTAPAAFGGPNIGPLSDSFPSGGGPLRDLGADLVQGVAGTVFGPAGAAGVGLLRGLGGILPDARNTGANTGLTMTPGTMTDQILPAQFFTTARAPKGYGIHTVTVRTSALLGGLEPGAKVAVKYGSDAAKALGVKRSKKPLISVSETNAIRKAARAKTKLEKAAKSTGLHVYKSPRTAARRRKSC